MTSKEKLVLKPPISMQTDRKTEIAMTAAATEQVQAAAAAACIAATKQEAMRAGSILEMQALRDRLKIERNAVADVLNIVSG